MQIEITVGKDLTEEQMEVSDRALIMVRVVTAVMGMAQVMTDLMAIIHVTKEVLADREIILENPDRARVLWERLLP